MSKTYNVAIVGATGAVGEAMLSILAERQFPVGTLHLLASERSAGGTLPEPVRAQALAATDFLATLMESDGTVPRYGCDDGANLLPLSGCPFEDFRPSVGAALALFKGERLPAGPWDETSLLLLGPISASADPALRP